MAGDESPKGTVDWSKLKKPPPPEEILKSTASFSDHLAAAKAAQAIRKRGAFQPTQEVEHPAKQADTEIDFDQLITPSDALDLLSDDWGYETKVRWIAGRLQSGLIVAGARAFERASMQRMPNNLDELVRISREMWQNWPCLSDHDFWRTGDITFYNRSSTGYGGPLVGRAFDVRFLPSGFPMLPSSSPPAPAEGDLSPSDARAWFNALSPQDQALGMRKLWQKAKDDHPELRVVRKVIEQFSEGRKTGRPPKA
ncbi:hypothetical protein SPAN111604_09935 [Sphingomonas antarctica]|uniref:hypothetical protein n=1 Tax=Sphingomonas antarctica TaxID=2040274 RepID=UPI0039EA2560